MKYSIKPLPPKVDLETKAILKKVASANRYLAELKGMSETIPNETILINTLALQEAKDSSAIENIITTHDEMYKAQLFEEMFVSASAKEVSRYADALIQGFGLVRKNKLLTENFILEIQKILEQNDAGYRRLPGTSLINEKTGVTIYTPPQDYDTIVNLMTNLIKYMNDDKMHDIDPLVKMAVIHFQFESIHPFYDGNGRSGRIINILYLVLNELLNIPILYLSRYIIQYKGDYYRLLQQVRETGRWEDWILYILTGIEQTSKETIDLIVKIRKLMLKYKQGIRTQMPKVYSQDLLNNLFRHPYTKIEFVMKDLQVSRLTARRYLELLVSHRFLNKEKIGRSNFYINAPLFSLFIGEPVKVQETEPIKTINPDISSR
jgi:Fic family protein